MRAAGKGGRGVPPPHSSQVQRPPPSRLHLDMTITPTAIGSQHYSFTDRGARILYISFCGVLCNAAGMGPCVRSWQLCAHGRVRGTERHIHAHGTRAYGSKTLTHGSSDLAHEARPQL